MATSGTGENGVSEEGEEAQLALEVAALKKRLKEAREATRDADFVDMTDEIQDLGCIKFKIRRKFKGHLAKVTDVQWANDSQLLLTAGQDGYLIIWDAMSGNKLSVIQLKIAWVMTCAFAPSREMAASGGLDDICSIFNLQTRDEEPRLSIELKGHSGFVSCARFIDDEQILTSSCDKTCALWNIERGKINTSYTGHTEGINSLAVPESDHNTFLTASSDLKCKLWDIRQAECTRTFSGHEQEINCVTFFPQHEYGFITACEDGGCCLWDIRADQVIAQYGDEFTECAATSVTMSNSGRLTIVGYDDFNCHVWDSLREERVGIMSGHDGRISRVTTSPNGLAIATGSWDNRCFIWTAK